MRRRLIITLTLFSILLNVKSQDVIKSFNIEHRSTEKTIVCDSFNYLRIIASYNTVIANDSSRYLNGKILGLSNKKLTIAPTIDITNIDYLCDSSFYSKKWQNEYKYTTNIDFSDILKIEYQSYSAHNWEAFGVGSILIGGLTTLIISPLISINYKNGSFNSDRYFKSAALGLGLVSFGIPITILAKKKTYYFKNHGPKKKKIWRIKYPD
jgi:hypothetical protein